jgi:hypothetical protein
VRWQAGSSAMLEVLARRILPVKGAELFTERDGRWYRLGEPLPAFDVPIDDQSQSVPLERIVVPEKLSAERPEKAQFCPLPLRLVRDRQTAARPATALSCSLAALATWAEQATSWQLSRLQAAWSGTAALDQGDAMALAVGSPGDLPLLPLGTRYWGNGLLVPLGYRVDPELPEAALRKVLEAAAEDLVLLDDDGFELIAPSALKPLTRGAIRLALARTASRARERGEGNRE